MIATVENMRCLRFAFLILLFDCRSANTQLDNSAGMVQDTPVMLPKSETEVWQDSEPYPRIRITIKKQSDATIELIGFESGADYSGQVEVVPGAYRFKNIRQKARYDALEGFNGKFPPNDACSVSVDMENPFYMYVMRCKSYQLHLLHALVPVGSQRTVHGISVKTLGAVPGRALTNVVLREQPSILAKRKQLRISESTVSPSRILNYMPQGYRFVVLARTLQKESIENSEDYWYFIKYPNKKPIGYDDGPYTMLTPEEQTAWVFGHNILPE